MGKISNWVMGGLLGAVSIIGLFMASRAQDDMFYFSGILIFLFSILLIFRLISKYSP